MGVQTTVSDKLKKGLPLSRHICAMASLRERAISSLATVSRGPADRAAVSLSVRVRFDAIADPRELSMLSCLLREYCDPCEVSCP